MIYKVYDFSNECKIALQNIEKDFKEKLINLIKPNVSWACTVSFILDHRAVGLPFVSVNSNPSLSLKDSYEVSNYAKQYFKSRLNTLEDYIKPHHALIVEMSFRELTEEEKEHRKASDKTSDNGISKNHNNLEEPTFVPQQPLYTFEKVILSEEIRNEILSAVNILKFQDLIYNRWGFIEIDPIPKSVLNFYGPPGTGKTMSAHGIAHELNKPLLALNYAEIESKYVGEAPKNLLKAFTAAKKYDAVLFFDEADSFLGKRIHNVTQGAEQALNSLRSQMLMLLEQHSGVIIFATNLVSNFDPAFESRILKHIKFELPNKQARAIIIKQMMPPHLPWETPLTTDDIDQLAEISDGLSGREIKGIILETLLNEASKKGLEAQFNFSNFKERFEHKQEEKKKLKEESDAILKQKIANAIKRKSEDSPESDQSEQTASQKNTSDVEEI